MITAFPSVGAKRIDAQGTGAPAQPPIRVSGLSHGHRRMIEGFYRAHEAGLRRFVRSHLRSETEAEDVLHDVFERICRVDDPESFKSPSAVLFKTAFRLTLNAIRRRRKSPIEGHCDLASLSLADEGKSPEEQLIIKTELERFMRILQALPPRCRNVVTLRTTEGLSYKEMSDRLGLSVSTLEKHIVKGRRAFRADRPEWDFAPAKRRVAVTA